MHKLVVINFNVIRYNNNNNNNRYKIVKKMDVFFLSICRNNPKKLGGMHKHIFKKNSYSVPSLSPPPI